MGTTKLVPQTSAPPRLRLTTPRHATMMIKVKTLTGKELKIDIEADSAIMHVKRKVEEIEGIPPEQQRLVFAGKQIADNMAAKDYNIEAGATLHLVLALRGGS